jgi:hypothetical protein
MAETYTYDLATDIGKVRRDIADTDTADAQFTDEELDSWIDEAGSVKGAAGLALLAWAAALGRDDESVSTGAWKGDRRDVAGKMRALAHDYFSLVGYKPAESGAFTQFTVDLGL